MEFTLSVRSFKVPATPFTTAWPPSFLGTHFAGNAGDFGREGVELIDHRVHDVGGPQKFFLQGTAVHFKSHALRQIAFRHGADHGARSRWTAAQDR